ncbi:beta-1,3-galactosyltransferase 1 isoform X1 [Syngnathus acus]|uniref:beta-1,3-galactosyltransferase 1 isoform X1 n=2 Tax=Syngnathus acus TaxID=161584 RepID=UPI001885C7B8|nr:beta-1,3-galactosyltransferase 1 isoform X1 [Syngnathus acus]
MREDSTQHVPRAIHKISPLECWPAAASAAREEERPPLGVMMVVRWLWICVPRVGKRGGRSGLLSCLCAATVIAAFFALMFVDVLEYWITSLQMDAAPVPHAGILPPLVPPTRPEEFLLMPSPLVCQRAKPYLITMVTSAPAHHRARQAIRDTWGGENNVMGLRVMTLFMLGVPSDPGLAKMLIEEARQHGDLVQGRYLDSYSNLTLKTLALQNWVRRFCPQAHFVAKVDDDVLFNPSALLHLLNRSHSPYEQADLYLGRVHLRVAPARNPDSKHYVPKEAYPPSVFPDYCSGTAYVLSRSALLKISLAASTSPLSTVQPPEDVFVGVCARAAGVIPTHSPLFSGGPAVPYGRCCYQAMVSVHHIAPQDMLRYWADMQASGPCLWLSTRASLLMCKVGALLGSALGLGKEA